ncbi:MAG: hypothetical protein EOP85_18825 [Verrucomicrobiaceae bacterium]|nr:MAG: hypothetical protein EOP85_18825 [Verrucomicrobiaceae bacterium]
MAVTTASAGKRPSRPRTPGKGKGKSPAALLGELAKGLKQQMYFWGRDVLHPSGNLLQQQGFLKSPSMGLQGTSCYSLPYEGGTIELHGACAGWYPASGGEDGFIYIRPMAKCFLWKGGPAPVPGEWPLESLTPIQGELPESATRFIRWWIQSEQWVTAHTGPDYRTECHRVHKRLPTSKAWLRPAEMMEWLQERLR